MSELTPEHLADLHKRAFTSQRPWTAKEFAGLLESPLVFCVGDARAFALGRVIADEAELLTLATAPEHQRQGVGRHMLTAYENTAQSRGAARSFLEVAADNAPAIALYQTAGYAQDGLRPNYYRTMTGDTVDAVLMSRLLPRR